MNILKQKHIFFNRTFSLIPPQLQKLYTFGFRALVTERVTVFSNPRSSLKSSASEREKSVKN